MLLALRIENFTVVEEVEVGFGPGLTVLTGETGAGKSILVDALGLLVGTRADADCVRTGADEAVVEAVFQRTDGLAARLEALGLPDHGDEVVLRRVVGRGGRSKVHVNGALASVGVLAQLIGQDAVVLGVVDRNDDEVDAARREGCFERRRQALRGLDAAQNEVHPRR